MAEDQLSDLSDDEQLIIKNMLAESEHDLTPVGEARRDFLKTMLAAGGGIVALQLFGNNAFGESFNNGPAPGSIENGQTISFRVNGKKKTLEVDSRMTLLDALRERMDLTGSKKGCDHGQCGACTVIVDGRRILSCLTLAATCRNKSVTTIEGIAKGKSLHPMQSAFIKHDGLQCGYCTPGQICSAVALLDEAKRGDLSYVAGDVRAKAAPLRLSDDEIRERMSGNICRCGAYTNIINAVREVHTGKDLSQAWELQPNNAGSRLQKGEANATI